ncbi:protein boule [Trichonephila inaurata madagascariensis]|uniref:Protein boule n=2 Tax=Trichonephila inaurata madagascariensis TaxID=2747483 RepID=A0A8X7C849_9ARAC|nr:protein boule [Trichonephila inaurata madagascariensis]
MATGGRDDSRSANVLKNGTPVPNSIFVGGISSNTTEDDLRNLFSKFGNVKATKVLFDKAGISRGYGFVTFETEDEADKVLKQAERFVLKEQKLNIAPAVKKQPYSRTLEASSVHNASIIWPGQPPSRIPAGFARESMYYPQTPWPFMWPQFYFQQQCPYPSISQAGIPHYLYPLTPTEYPFQQVAGSDYSESSSADSGESIKNRSKPATSTHANDYDRGRSGRTKHSDAHNTNMPKYNGGNIDNPSNCMHSAPMSHLHHPVFAKTLNGVPVMPFPSSMVMGSPTILYVKDGNESENVLTELGFLHSPILPGTLTPPTTPLVQFPCDFGANTFESTRKN